LAAYEPQHYAISKCRGSQAHPILLHYFLIAANAAHKSHVAPQRKIHQNLGGKAGFGFWQKAGPNQLGQNVAVRE